MVVTVSLLLPDKLVPAAVVVALRLLKTKVAVVVVLDCLVKAQTVLEAITFLAAQLQTTDAEAPEALTARGAIPARLEPTVAAVAAVFS